jgi:hypothetical protein
MQKLLAAGPVLKAISYALLIAGGGYVLGDEIAQRLERATMRSACYGLQVAQIPQMNDLVELSIRHKCRVNIP